MPQDFTPLLIVVAVAAFGAVVLVLFKLAASRIARPGRRRSDR